MRNIPVVTKNLLIINVLVFAALYVFGRLGIDINEIFGLHFFLAQKFHVWQFVTYMFCHGGLTHIFFNMFALWMFGRIVEQVWGPKRFLVYYLVCGLGAGLIQEGVQLVSYYVQGLNHVEYVMMQPGAAITMDHYLDLWTTVGASGAIYGILLAFGMLFPEERIFIFPLPVPVKAKWFVVLYAGLELMLGLGMPGDSVAHFAHLGGMLFGFFLIRHWRRNSFVYGASYGDGFLSRASQFWNEKIVPVFKGTRKRDTRNMSDWDYNARKNEEQKEIDRILDKIRKSGYDSLSADEKRKLFESGKK